MKRAAMILALMAVAVEAADERATLLRPAATASWAVTDTSAGEFARFSGNTWVDGTLVATWIAGVDSDKLNEVKIRIYLDGKSVARLPTFTLPGAPQIRHDGQLEIVNTDQALRMAFPATQVALFGKQQVRTLRTRASFRIESYQLSLDCDHQWASATLADVHAPRLLTAGNIRFDPGCT